MKFCEIFVKLLLALVNVCPSRSGVLCSLFWLLASRFRQLSRRKKTGNFERWLGILIYTEDPENYPSNILQRSLLHLQKSSSSKIFSRSLQIFKDPWRYSKILWGFSPGYSDNKVSNKEVIDVLNIVNGSVFFLARFSLVRPQWWR